jgi:hypothetical protein
MNYKIKITADNQAIVKRIADENGMNPYKWDFDNFFQFYTISNNLFGGSVDKSDYSELTTEQFVQMFDKKETEWQPKRGDRVLVWDNSEEPLNAIYLETVIGCTQPFLVVDAESEEDFLKGNEFDFVTYKHMKPLPIEQPKKDKVAEVAYQYCKKLGINNTSYSVDIIQSFINGAKWQSEQPKETDFKTKVIELIEKENQKALVHYDESINSRNYLDAHAYGFKSSIYKELIEKIKQL